MVTFLVIALVVGFLSVPTMLAARVAGVYRTGFLCCLVATLLAVLASYSVETVLPNKWLSSLVEFLICAAIFKFTLKGSFLQGAGVAIVLLVLQTIAILGIGTVGFAIHKAV